MKPSVIALTGVLLILSGCGSAPNDPSVTGHNLTVVDKVEDGSHYHYTAYRDFLGREKIEGKFEMWYPNGKKYIEASYSKGELNGPVIIFWKDGAGRYEGVWKDGRPWDGVVQVGHELKKFRDGKFVALVED